MYRSTRPVVGIILPILLLATIVSQMQAEITDEQVRTAIERGIRFLRTQQDKTDGKWAEHDGQPGGLTSLCVLAMINAGVPADDPDIQRALQYIRGLGTPRKTYAAALQIMALCAADPDRDRLLIRQSAEWLESTQNTSGSRAGAWGYGGPGGRVDNSNSQFALLALHEAEQVGVQIKKETWERALAYWSAQQLPDGSWNYLEQVPQLPSTGSMTCAGIASLIIASGKFTEGEARVINGRIECCGQQTDNDRIQRGLEWLARPGRFTVRSNPNSAAWKMYYLYGLERVGRLTGSRTIGRYDWYRVGAEHLVEIQDPLTGHWKGTGIIEDNATVSTALALLFLSKGRRPVLIARLQHSDQGANRSADWNRHRGALQNLTRRVERTWDLSLSWQTMDAKFASVDNLLQSPILFLSGKDVLDLSHEQKQNLKAYVNQGGFLFAEACDGQGCDGKAFDQAFRKLMKELFPESPMRRLPPDHPVWFAEARVDPDHIPEGLWLEGIDACCRTSVVYSPYPLTCYWNLSTGPRESTYPANVEQQIEAVMRIGQNVAAYATNRELKAKLDRPRVSVTDSGSDQAQRGTLIIPKLSHAGGADDAPNALRNLMLFMRKELEMRVNTDRRLLSPTDPALSEYPVTFMHGRRSFRFTDAERKALGQYLERGGFLLADAICGSPEFAASFRREMESMFPDAQLVRISPDHPMFTRDYRGFDVRKVQVRDPKLRASGDDRLETRVTTTTPSFEGLEIDGRLAVVFSPYDISCGLESQTSLECRGYVEQDAARLGVNILLYALMQ